MLRKKTELILQYLETNDTQVRKSLKAAALVHGIGDRKDVLIETLLLFYGFFLNSESSG